MGKAKAKNALVLLKSMVTGYPLAYIRPRLADKAEIWRYDPMLGQETIFKEVKKLKSIRREVKYLENRQENV